MKIPETHRALLPHQIKREQTGIGKQARLIREKLAELPASDTNSDCIRHRVVDALEDSGDVGPLENEPLILVLENLWRKVEVDHVKLVVSRIAGIEFWFTGSSRFRVR